MQSPGKALQLILFTVDGTKSRTLLSDSLGFHPDYRIGDIIHLLRPSIPTRLTGNDHQYVVRNVKHIISNGETGADSPAYILLVEVAELAALERDEPGIQSDYLAAM